MENVNDSISRDLGMGHLFPPRYFGMLNVGIHRVQCALGSVPHSKAASGSLTRHYSQVFAFDLCGTAAWSTRAAAAHDVSGGSPSPGLVQDHIPVSNNYESPIYPNSASAPQSLDSGRFEVRHARCEVERKRPLHVESHISSVSDDEIGPLYVPVPPIMISRPCEGNFSADTHMQYDYHRRLRVCVLHCKCQQPRCHFFLRTLYVDVFLTQF